MSIGTKWLRQPQNLLLRRILFQIHLWVGIGLALYVVMISITGSLLVFRREILAAATSKHVTPQPHRLNRNELEGIFQRKYPGYAVESINAPRLRGEFIADQAVEVQLLRGDDSLGRFADPYTGEDLGSSRRPLINSVLWLANLHDDLLARDTGRIVNGIGAILATLLAITGAILWWPGIRNWRRGLVIEWERKRYGFQWSLHNALGIWMLLFIFLWGFSGIYLCFPQVFNAVVDYLEPLTDATLQARFGDDFLSWLAKLHFGRFSGLTIKAIWTVLGLVPAVLAVTGVMMWWYRVIRREPKRIEQLDAAAAPVSEVRAPGSIGDRSSAAL